MYPFDVTKLLFVRNRIVSVALTVAGCFFGIYQWSSFEYSIDKAQG